jgi:hypothetical protein
MTEPDDVPEETGPDSQGYATEVIAQITSQLSTSAVVVLAAGLPAIWPVVLPAVAGGVAWAVMHRWLRDAADRAQRFVDTAEAASDLPFEELQATASESVELRHLLARAARSAVETYDQWTIDRLAECFVAAVTDPAVVDEQLLVIETLGSLGPIDIRLLRILDQPGPYEPEPSNPQNFLEIVEVFDPTMWPKTNIVDADPGLADGLDTVLGKLQMLGMVAKVDVPGRPTWLVFQLTKFGRRCTDHLGGRPAATDATKPGPTFARLAPDVAGGWEGAFIAEGWNHALPDLKSALLLRLRAEGDRPELECQEFVERALFNRIWFNEETGGGHDCNQHKPEEAQPACYKFRRVVHVEYSPPRRGSSSADN